MEIAGSRAELPKHPGQVLDLARDQVHNALFLLCFAIDSDHFGAQHFFPELLDCLFPDNYVHGPTFIFECQKHNTLRATGALTNFDKTRNPGETAVRYCCLFG